jgi:hypothetical protein
MTTGTPLADHGFELFTQSNRRMLIVLAFAAAAHEPIYSLIPPLDRTNLSEVGNWTFRGSAVNMKSYVRLTSDAITAEDGALCYRAKTAFRD